MKRYKLLNTSRIFFQKPLLVSIFFFLSPFQGHSSLIEKTPPYLTVIGNIAMADGLGKQSIELIQSFKEEFSIGFVHTRKANLNDVPLEIIPILTQKKPLGSVLLLEDLIWCPQAQTYELVLPQKKEEQLLLAYSVFETDFIPIEWVERLNKHFDAVAVADPYLVHVYRQSGVKIPIFELPLGLELTDFLSQPIKTRSNPIFTFGALSFGSQRKNLIKLIQGFCLAFKNDPHVKLRINCRGAESIVEKRIREEIEKLGLTNVEFTLSSLNKNAYLNLFKSLDCFVTVSQGEGFSIQPREAMALGIPVIATNNTAQGTICKSSLVKSIPSEIPTPAKYAWTKNKCGNFFDCHVVDIAQALKEVYYNYDHYLKMNNHARAWASQYDYGNLIPLYRSFLKPKQLELGNENRLEPNKLITNSRKLYEKYAKIVSKK